MDFTYIEYEYKDYTTLISCTLPFFVKFAKTKELALKALKEVLKKSMEESDSFSWEYPTKSLVKKSSVEVDYNK